MAYSFGLQGALPTQNPISGGTSATTPSVGGTPASRALNTMGNSAPQIGPSSLALLTSAGAIPKSQTITSPDGSSHSMTYQSPPTQTDTASTVGTTPGVLGSPSNPQTPSTATGNGNNNPLPGQSSSQTTPPTTTQFGGLINQATANAQNEQAVAASAKTDPTIQAEEAQLAAIPSLEQNLTTQYGNMPGLAGVAQANVSNIEQGLGARETGLSNAINAGLAPTNTELTGLSNAQSGLLGAAAPIAPSTVSPGQAVFNPSTGTYSSASSGGSSPAIAPSGIDQSAWNQYIQDYATGNMGAIPSSITGNSNLSGQLQQAVQAQNPGFSYNNAVGLGAAAQQNATTLGTAGVQGIAGVEQSIPALKAANVAAQGIANTITSFLNQNPQINSSPSTLANAAQQWLQGKQLSDPNYQTFFNYLTEYANTLAPVLGVGGDSTNLKTEIAQGFINSQASGTSIQQVLANMGQLATNKINNIQSGATGGGVTNTNNGTTNYNF